MFYRPGNLEEPKKGKKYIITAQKITMAINQRINLRWGDFLRLGDNGIPQ
jgi:hypothetical protein